MRDTRSQNEVLTHCLAVLCQAMLFSQKTVSDCRKNCRVCPALPVLHRETFLPLLPKAILQFLPPNSYICMYYDRILRREPNLPDKCFFLGFFVYLFICVQNILYIQNWFVYCEHIYGVAKIFTHPQALTSHSKML